MELDLLDDSSFKERIDDAAALFFIRTQQFCDLDRIVTCCGELASAFEIANGFFGGLN
jgi:hypothetical protein